MRPHRHSIRSTITALAVVLSAALFAVVSLSMSVVLSRQLTDNFDEGLDQRADTIAAVIADTKASTLPVEEDLLIQIVDYSGHVQLSSSNLNGVPPITPMQTGYYTTTNVPGRHETFRILTRRIQTPNGPALLLVGHNYDDVVEPVRILNNLLLITVPIVILILGALTWLVVGRTLRPVETLRVEMETIRATNIGNRVSNPQTGDEIERLAQTMNETLDRLEYTIRQQEQFVADASHELRSPLTRIRSELEVALLHTDHSDPAQTYGSVLDETLGMQHLVEDLLILARRDDDPTITSPHAPLDLDDIVLREARRLRERGRIILDTRHVSAAHVLGNADQLTRAIRNVFENAERHATSLVTIRLEEHNSYGVLTVSDDGAGIATDQRDRIFERFTRLDEARTRDAGGTGLGLAIARDIIHRHAGTINVANDLPTTFTIKIPLREA